MGQAERLVDTKMTKKQVQERVFQNGKPLALSKFKWYSEELVFRSEESDLVMDFRGLEGVTITVYDHCCIHAGDNGSVSCGNFCTILTGQRCTVWAGANTILGAGDHCTYKVGNTSKVFVGIAPEGYAGEHCVINHGGVRVDTGQTSEGVKMGESEDLGEELGVEEVTPRGLRVVKFRDDHLKGCSLQESERTAYRDEGGTTDSPLGGVWLGIDDAEPRVMALRARELGIDYKPGADLWAVPYPLPKGVMMTTRMHLNAAQVRGLIARLQAWLNTGDFRIR